MRCSWDRDSVAANRNVVSRIVGASGPVGSYASQARARVGALIILELEISSYGT
jgi:hypothetical protein